jgi:Protein of unknown function (DUF3311)
MLAFLYIYTTKGDYVMATRSERRNRRWLRWLLVIPFIAVLFPPFYNFRAPEFIGIPFFYWYQLLWIIITSIITAVVYFAGA